MGPASVDMGMLLDRVRVRRNLRMVALVLAGLWIGVAPAASQVWELVWADEFETDGPPDPSAWTFETGGGGWGNQEAQFYTNRPENARVEDGRLVIEARREAYQGSDYTSARLITRDKATWRYGRFEIRARLPGGRGTWPAIWMLANNDVYGDSYWPDNGEIDIMEYVGYDPDTVHGTIHTYLNNHTNGRQSGASYELPTAEEAFHVYAVEWSPEKIDFFVDDVIYHTYTNTGLGWQIWPFDQPFFLILNVAIGGTWGGAQGIDDSIFPVQLEIDYVRVYKDIQGEPQVTLTAPAAAQTLAPEASLTLTADAADEDGTVAQVAFLQGDGVLGTDAEPPYALTVTDLAAGCYRVAAEVTDDQGKTRRSETVPVTVGDGACGQAPYLMTPHPVPGTIEAEYYDLGGANVGYRDLDAANGGGGIRAAEGVDIAAHDEGGSYVTGIASREWLAYTVDVAETGPYTLALWVADDGAGGAVRLDVDGVDATGTVGFETGDGWRAVQVPGVRLETGVRQLRLNLRASGFRLDRLTLTPEFSTPVEPTDTPHTFRLAQNYPNPFNPTTTIAYDVAAPGPVALTVFNGFGQQVATLVEGHRPAGRHQAVFDAGTLPSGTYFYRLTTPSGTLTRAMTLLR